MWLRLEVLDQWSWQVCTERVMPVPDGESGAYTHALILLTHPSHAIPHPAMPAMSPSLPAHPHPRAGALGCLQSRRSGGSYALRCTSLPENWLRMVTYGAWGSLPAVT